VRQTHFCFNRVQFSRETGICFKRVLLRVPYAWKYVGMRVMASLYWFSNILYCAISFICFTLCFCIICWFLLFLSLLALVLITEQLMRLQPHLVFG
jgi:hypothetical protein